MKKLFLVMLMVIGLIGTLMPPDVSGEELLVLGGISDTQKVSTYGYAVGFHHGISGNFGGEILYVNDGHADKDDQYSHRDGLLLLASYDLRLFDERLVLRSLIGPYFFCDTQNGGAQIKNGLGGYAGIGMNLYLDPAKRFFVTARAGYVIANESLNSFSFLAGGGFRFDPPKNKEGGGEKINEISFGLGQSVSNLKTPDRKSDGLAVSLQLRRKIFDYADITGSLISEGERQGIILMPQAVIKISDHLSAGIGVGPYISYEDREIKFNGATAITAAYEFAGGIVFRGTFMRILASSANDSSDFFAIAIGYRF